ncbi:membrane protein insertion efficiency factor YidD [uncultured Hyphomonas sp.]|uniref:membrane protein insertion efficiency factor YidD n=1 Tax=uncultured Hyphomonas sp. TaxID=225298 RepID=UPI002AAC1DE2|nr:membrane protein insertion efficiency factor YidD [uncultured Hyphomonas sp.]
MAHLDLDVPEELRPSTLRRLGIRPDLDNRVDAMPPLRGWGARQAAIALLRLYRWVRPDIIGNRCVYEPSCSRYSELAFRTKPVATAFRLTFTRLHRCKPGHGGTDLSELELPE